MFFIAATMCGILAVLGCVDNSQAKRSRIIELSRRFSQIFPIHFVCLIQFFVFRSPWFLFLAAQCFKGYIGYCFGREKFPTFYLIFYLLEKMKYTYWSKLIEWLKSVENMHWNDM